MSNHWIASLCLKTEILKVCAFILVNLWKHVSEIIKQKQNLNCFKLVSLKIALKFQHLNSTSSADFFCAETPTEGYTSRNLSPTPLIF